MYTLTTRLAQTKRFVSMLLFVPVLLLITSVSQYSYAEIIQLSGSNQPTNVSARENSQSQIAWRASQRSSMGGQATISSSVGEFYAVNGELLGRSTTPIQSSRLTQLRATTLFVLNESLTIPLSVIRAAQQAGSSQIIYQRSFVDSQGANIRTAAVSFQISSGTIASQLLVNRIQMEFDDGRKNGVFGNQATFSASAYISYQGTGLLNYTWEIASPPSTNNVPVFFPLISRKQYLLSGGQITLQSPALPSTTAGNYLVRLKIAGIRNSENIPTLRYTINKSAINNPNRSVAKIIQKSPLVDTLLVPATEFTWNMMNGAAAYQLEIHTKPTHNINPLAIEQDKPITGVLIPANKTRMKVGKISRAYLIPGSTYYWRVVAINETGQIIGRSEFRRIKF